MPSPNTVAYNPVVDLSPRALLGSLFSFEALLVLYIFAGQYKTDPRFAWVPVDLTATFFALSVVIGSLIISISPIYKKGLYVIFAMLCFTVWLAVTKLWSPSNIYSSEKLFFIATLELWAVAAAALIVAPDPQRVQRLLTVLLLFAIWMGIEALVLYAETGGTTRMMNVGSGNYLGLGRVCGLGALIALVAWLFGRHRGATTLLFLALFLGLMFVLTAGGGRGPLLATVAGILVPLIVGLRLTKRRILYSRYQLSMLALSVLIACVLTGYMAVTDRAPTTLKRLELLTEDELSGSAAVRANHYTNAVRLWLEAPVLGHGLGSWPILTGRPDVQRHPHNLFLEVMVETGLVGLVILLVLLGTALRPLSFDRLRSDPTVLCVLMLFVNTFSNSIVSGDLPDNRAMFLLLGLLTMAALRKPAPMPAPRPGGAPPALAASPRDRAAPPAYPSSAPGRAL